MLKQYLLHMGLINLYLIFTVLNLAARKLKMPYVAHDTRGSIALDPAEPSTSKGRLRKKACFCSLVQSWSFCNMTCFFRAGRPAFCSCCGLNVCVPPEFIS